MNSSKYDLTSPQRNIWLMENFNENTPINVITGLVNIKNGFNASLCDGAINNVIKNNDIMRARVIKEGSETFQTILDYEYEKIEIVDMTSYSEKEIAEYIDSHALQSLNLYNEKLYDFKILKYNENQGSIFMRIHHIIADAWSCSKIGTQLIQYMENTDGSNNEEIEKSKPSYIEYINSEKEYENSEKYTKDSEFWKEYLSGIEEVISLKDHTNIVSTKASRYSVKLDKEINEKILNYCKENKISPYVLFLTALSTYVYRIKDKNDFVIGTPILNRSTFKEKQMLGMFVSTMPVRIKISENEKFIDLAKKIALDNMTLFRHQKYPYSKTLEYVHANSNIKTNLYNIIISYQNARTNIFDNNKYSTSWPFSKAIEDELQIHIMDMDDTGILTINYDYLNELFDSIEIEYLHTRIMALINNAIQNIDVNIEDIRIMSIDEENKILYEFNDTYREYPKDRTVIELFEEQVEKTPDNIALVFEDKSMTYKELNEKANQLAHYLVEEKGIKPNDIVALILKRSFDMIIAILGVLKSGAAYLPIDPDFPTERIEYMLNDSNSKLAIHNIDFSSEVISKIDLRINSFEDFKSTNIKVNNSLDNLVYIIYTSGTTGRPKGVMIQHKNLLHLVYSVYLYQNLEEVSVFGAFSSYSFDISILEFFIPLVFGKKIILANEDEQKIPVKISNLIKKYKIEIVNMTPTRMKLLLSSSDIDNAIKSLKRIMLGGEVFPPQYYSLLRKYAENAKIYNGYGPTEITVWSSAKEIMAENEINIGKSLPNVVSYILDKKNRLVPIGSNGELCISGDGVAKGYYNNSISTSEKFIYYNDRLTYKTGDISKYNYKGELEYLGRLDSQIKLHGLRIEISEIENVIKEYDDVGEAIVIINEKEQICAYYTSSKPIDYNEIYNYLKSKLPKYMIPKLYKQVDKFEINTLGKVDRKKLPKIELAVNEKIYPKNEIERKISYIFSEVLKINNIGINDDFFELGGDSLSLIQLITRINDEFCVEISIRELSNNCTVQDIEKYIEKLDKNKSNFNIKSEKYPLSSAQFGIFTNYSLNPDNIMYNIPFEMKFSNNINIEKLINAVKQVVNSADTFFTKIEMINGELFQKIDKSRKYDVPVYYILEKDYEKRKKDCLKSFDLLDDLLFNINIFKTENNVYMVVNIHHIIFDGLSMNIFLDKLKKAYNEENLEKEKNSFGQFALYEKELKTSEKYNKAKKYFTDMFAEELPDNNMILDNKRKKERTFVGNKLTFKIDKKTSNLIYNFVNDNKVTLNSVFLSMFNLLLSKYMYSNDIIVGMATSGRNIQEEIDQIGMFVKTIPFRTKLNVDDNVISYIKDTQTRVLDSIDNDIYSYESLVKDLNITRDPSRNPLFDVMFVYQNTGMPDIRFENEKVELSGISTNTSKFDITLEVMPNNDVFDINIEYASDLFSKETINRFANHYINAINSMLDNKSGKLSDIDIITKEEKDTILNKYNDTKTDYPNDKTVIDLFEENVVKYPNKKAIIFYGESLTYKELNDKANQLSRYLIKIGVKPNDIISIMMDKSIEYIISILAVLKCGAIYISLTKELPDERMKYMILNANSKLILTFEKYYRDIVDIPIIDVNKVYDEYCKLDNTNININRTSNDIVHIIYTSGTTGNPKGIMIINRGIIRLVTNSNYLSFTENDVMLNSGTLTFDTSTFEIWGAFINGMTLHMLLKEDVLNPLVYKKYISNNSITTTLIPTPIFNKLVEYDAGMFKTMKSIYVGGDVMLAKYANNLHINCPNVKLYNVYGPAENTVICTANLIDKIYNEDIPIGKVVSNNVCYVIDKCGRICPIGVPGDLYVGGDGLGLGYINREELTKEKFTNIEQVREKIYKTGDLTYWDNQGNLNYISRIDTQIKIRGQRIEILEIQNRILEINGIKEVAINIIEKGNQKYLIAYYVASSKIKEEEIRAYLNKYLPVYMIPYKFVEIDKIPLTQNGKVDKKSLPIIDLFDENKVDLPKNEEQRKLLKIYKKVLSNDNIGITSDFFKNGGDSLLVVSLVSEMVQNGYNLTYSDVFKYTTVLEIYNYLFNNSPKNSISNGIENYDYKSINSIIKNNIISNKKINIKNNLGNVLLTGVTGFLGIHVLDELIKSGVKKVYCLVREKNNENIHTRIRKQLKFFFNETESKIILDKIELIKGDLTNENIFANIDNSDIINNIDIIINCAACVKHYGNLKYFMNINVDAVRNLIKFCNKYNKELIQISTLSVSGNIIEGGQVIQKGIVGIKEYSERDLYIGQDLDNVYVYTKFLAERLVLEAISEYNLKAKIIRLGNLTGRYTDGKFQPNVEENAFSNRIKTLVNLKVMPKNVFDIYLEMTPIDYASNAVVKIAKLDENYNIYHLFNHNHAQMPFVIDTLKEFGININVISDEETQKLINKYLSNNDKVSEIEGILSDIDKDGSLRYNNNIIIKSEFTKKILKELNFQWPNIDKEYLKKYIQYLIDIKFINVGDKND